jgi:hypothetical protein
MEGDSGSPHPKKLKTQKIIKQGVGNFLLEQDGILLVGCLEKRAAMTAKYNIALLDNLKQQLVPKCQGKLLKGILFLQDNSDPHKEAIIQQKLADFHFEIPKHSAYYSPDLFPSDFCLISNVKKHISGRMFLSIEEVTLAADR